MEETPLKIDLHAIVRNRMPKKISRWIPNFLIRWLEKIVCQDELNGILERTFPNEGVAFADAALKDLDIHLDVCGIENIPDSGRFIFASNHPLGGLDGIALISVIGEIYGDGSIKFPVNDMLMHVRPLKSVFIPINKFGAQGKAATRQINDTYASDLQMLFFPAGLVSRKHKNGEIKDLEWQKAFVAKAIEYKRDIVPIYFDGLNSEKFYNIARWRKRLGLKFNIEQIFLPSEVCKSKGKSFKIYIGKPISYQSLEEKNMHPRQLADEIKEVVYSLKQNISV